MAEMIMIKGKQHEQVCPGVIKSGSAYKVKCSITGDWMYHNEDRYLKQVAKYGSPEKLGLQLVSQAGKRIQKGEPAKKDQPKVTEEYAGDTPGNKDNPYQSNGKAWVHPDVRAPGYDGPLSCNQRRDGSLIKVTNKGN